MACGARDSQQRLEKTRSLEPSWTWRGLIVPRGSFLFQGVSANYLSVPPTDTHNASCLTDLGRTVLANACPR